MLLNYEPPPPAEGSEDNQRTIIALITDAVLDVMPRDWPMDRMQVFGERVWKTILGRHFGKVWFKPDVALKAAREVYADMTEYDRKPRAVGPEYRLAPPSKPAMLMMGEEHDFPEFYARMKREIETAPRILCRDNLLRLLETGMRRHRAHYGLKAAE